MLLDSPLRRKSRCHAPINLLDSADRPDTASVVVPDKPPGSRPDTPASVPGEPSVSRPDTPASVLSESPRPDTPTATLCETSVGRSDTLTGIQETPTPMERRLEATGTTEPQPSTSHYSLVT